MNQSTLTPKQAFEIGVERQRYRRQIGNMVTKQMNDLYRKSLWEFLEIYEVEGE